MQTIKSSQVNSDIHAIKLSEKDNVATALVEIQSGTSVNVRRGTNIISLIVRNNIPFGHKFALKNINQDEEILKYGLPIGSATCSISEGSHVHTQNVKSTRGSVN